MEATFKTQEEQDEGPAAWRSQAVLKTDGFDFDTLPEDDINEEDAEFWQPEDQKNMGEDAGDGQEEEARKKKKKKKKKKQQEEEKIKRTGEEVETHNRRRRTNRKTKDRKVEVCFRVRVSLRFMAVYRFLTELVIRTQL